MRQLVIGCGYVGLRVARAWLRQGRQVSALTRSAKNARRLAHEGIQPIIGDVTQPETLADLPQSDTVLYAVGFDRGNGHSQRKIYVDGLANVLQEISPRIGRLIYLSSTSVYGQTAGQWVDETSPCQPIRPNGQACLEAEAVLWRYFEREKEDEDDDDDKVTENKTPPGCAHVLRLAGIYGPGRLLSRVESLRAGQPFAGNPDAYLNLIHVNDVVAAVLACESRGHPGATYLICDNQPITRREYFESLAKLIGAPSSTFADRDSTRHDRESLNKRCINRRMREQLQVELAFPTLETGLPDALNSTC